MKVQLGEMLLLLEKKLIKGVKLVMRTLISPLPLCYLDCHFEKVFYNLDTCYLTFSVISRTGYVALFLAILHILQLE